MLKESLWRTLFLILLTVNITVITTTFTDYSGRFSPLNAALVDEMDRALQGDTFYYNNYMQSPADAVSQLQALKPPFWKKGKHLEYTALVSEMRSMSVQVRMPPQQQTFNEEWKANYRRMANVKEADIDRIMKSIEDNQKQQQKAREQLIPIYKTKLERLKFLGKSLS